MSRDDKPAAKSAAQDARDATGWLTTGAYVLSGLIALHVAVEVGAALTPIDVSEGVLVLVDAALRALIAQLPSLLILCALWDFAALFSRCSAGEMFTERNVASLRGGGDALIGAAVASALITPTLLSWTAGEWRGFVFDINDLALGVGAMGLAISGLARVWREAVRLKDEADSIV